MRPTQNVLPAVTAAAVSLLVLAGCGTTTESPTPPGGGTTPVSTAAPSAGASGGAVAAPGVAVPAGAYLSKAEYAEQSSSRAGTKVVYFFHAPWCPTCRATEKALERDGIPAGLTLVKVDFDTERELRQRYGVTTQHTFVQVDPSGAELAKWTGSRGGAEILSRTV
jgi:thiol-disulfide isomerase/thioredoxin